MFGQCHRGLVFPGLALAPYKPVWVNALFRESLLSLASTPMYSVPSQGDASHLQMDLKRLSPYQGIALKPLVSQHLPSLPGGGKKETCNE